MSTFRNPVGPQPSRVYWRRRLIVALGLLAVIVVIILIVVRPGAGAPATPGAGAGPTSTTSPAPTSTLSTDPADAVACDMSKVTVEAATDAETYEPGVTPNLSFVLKSTMTVPCTVPAGSDVQEYRVTSGEELIWSSKDCQTEPAAATVLLMPGVPKEGPAVPWDRTRSSVETCATAREQVVAGGASYHLGVVVGELTSAATTQFLLY